MKAIDFVVRTGMGAITRGEISTEQSVTTIDVGGGQEVSLNLRQMDMRGYQRAGDNLEIVLADGRVVVLDGYFSADGASDSRLFVSADGYLNEVDLVEGQEGVLYAQYGPTEAWGKWSPSDDLIFLGGNEVATLGAAEEGTVSMLGAGLLGGSGLLGIGAGAAAIVGGSLIDSGTGHIAATVNESGVITIGGDGTTDADRTITITGTAEPNSDVEVTIGGVSVLTTSDSTGNWTTTFEGPGFPGEGDFMVAVHVVEPDGTVVDLVGPSVLVDTIGPDIAVTVGTDSTGDLVNAVNHADGVEITGTGEVGAALVVTIDGYSHSTVVGSDGTWTVTFLNTELVGGEYSSAVTIVATDAAGNSTTLTDTVVIDTIADPITINTATFEGDGTLNAAETADGIEITGTSTPGVTITVDIDGVSMDVVVAADGTWSAVFGPASLPGGEYDATVTTTTTDAAGNSNTVTGTVRIDTLGSVAIDSALVEGDDIINATEASDGVTLTGSSEPGSTVEVSFGGVTHSAVVAGDGSWSVDFAASEIASGEYDADFSVTATDSAGNISTTTRTVRVDTQTAVTLDTGLAGGDDLVNALEASNGVTLTGTAEIGSTVEVTLGSVTHTATVDASGNWSVDFAASDIPAGAYTSVMTVVSTDAAGNTQTVSGDLEIDTLSFVAFDSAPVEGDDIVNAAEASDGITLTGTTQPGSTVEVTVEGVTHSATVDAAGNWSVDFAASDIAAGTYEATATVTSTNANGNTSTATDTFRVDTEGSIAISSAPIEGDDVVSAVEAADGVTLTGITEPGSTVEVTLGSVTHSATVDASGNWSVDFAASDIPAGDYLADITAVATDSAGNVTTATDSVRIDTVSSITFDASAVEGDGIVNGVEAADGVVLTGTTEPGSTVTVRMGSVTRTATVDASGNWSATFAPTDVPAGEYTANVIATATDAAGNISSTTGTVEVDTFVRDFTMDNTSGGSDGVINAAEATSGLVLTGTTEPGSTVEVTLGSVTHSATVAADGSWTVGFASTDIPAGEYSTSLTAVSTDAAGNVDTVTDIVRVDTEAGSLTLSSAPIEGDGTINAAEASDGVTLTGTSDPGAIVSVTLGHVTHAVVTDSAGNWSAYYAAGEIPQGTYDADITATMTDAAGNTRTETGTVHVDTVVDNLSVSIAPIEGDDVINEAELADGFAVSGTVEVGATVNVTIEGVTHAATVDASGNWTVAFGATDLPAGEYSTMIDVAVTDLAGNTAATSRSVEVDTLVNALSTSAAPVEGDDVVNAAEAADGVTLNGQVEAGSSVVINFAGVDYAATVDGSGNWSVDIPASGIAAGSYDAAIVVNATDAAGNTSSINDTLTIDTDAPEGPVIASYTRDVTGIRGISTDMANDTLTVSQVASDGTISEVTGTETDIAVINETLFSFDSTVPDGSHLIVTSEDNAGNVSGTYLVLDETATSVVELSNAGLGAYQIEAVDLQFAQDSSLTITEADLLALSSNSDTLVVSGGADDTVTILGAIHTGSTTTVDGQIHDVYTLGGTGTLIIDDDITVVI